MKKLFLLYCYLLCCTALLGQRLPDGDNSALKALQSIHDEAHPIISTNGKTLFFSRKGHPQNIGDDDQYDIWIAFRQNDDTWGKPVHMPLPINNRADNFVVAIDTDGQGLYLWDDSQEKGAELVYTKKKGRSWTNPRPVQIQNFSPTSTVSYTMADENQLLILTANTDEGRGGRDVYFATKNEKGLWTEPINLGTTINSSSEEMHAYLAADNKTLYFLTNGFGETEDLMTLMISQREGSSWTEWTDPTTTGITIDPKLFSTHFSISSNGKMMYIGGKETEEADKQLFVFAIPEQYQPEPVSLIVGKLVDVETGVELDGNVVLESLASFGESQSQRTNKGGRFQFVSPTSSNFNLSAQVPGYFAKSIVIADQSLQELDKEDENNNTDPDYSMSPEVDQLNVRLQKLNKSLQELYQQRTNSQVSLESRKRTNWSPSKENAQLAAIELKYKKALGLAIEDNEKASSTGDSELDRMKRTFRKHNDVHGSSSIKTKRKPIAPAEESQLEAMKRKYKEANNQTETTTITKKSGDKEAVVASSTALDHSSFSDLVLQSHAALEEELGERVVKELRADLLQEVSFKMHAAMDEDSREQYAAKLQRKTAVLESEVRKDLRRKYKTQVKKELRGELLEVIEEELRDVLREEVKRELRNELESEVREELRLELEYLLTQEMAADVQKELITMVKQLKKNSVPSPGKYYGGAIEKNAQRKTIKKPQGEINITLYPLKKDRVIPLENIFFKANTDEWKETSLPELNRVYDLLQNNPALKMEIGSHTNGWCSTEFGKKLSTSRAKAVADYLIERGITPSRLTWFGYGKTQPLVPNDSVENCKQNQRLELRVL